MSVPALRKVLNEAGAVTLSYPFYYANDLISPTLTTQWHPEMERSSASMHASMRDRNSIHVGVLLELVIE